MSELELHAAAFRFACHEYNQAFIEYDKCKEALECAARELDQADAKKEAARWIMQSFVEESANE